MQLNACLLLFIIATDKTLAFFHYQCHGHVSLAQEPTGHIGFSSVGVSDRPLNLQTDQNNVICTRTLQIPAGHTVLLKLVWLERGSNVSLRCVSDQENQALEIGDTALLAGCDQNKATLTWTGAGHSSNAFQLFYNVTTDARNSTEDYASPRSDLDILQQTGSSLTQSATRTEEVTGHPSQSVEWDSSGASTPDPGLMLPTTPLLGLTLAGSTDREAVPFPEEEQNNEADVSGAAQHTDSPGTQDYFHTITTDSMFQTLPYQTETSSALDGVRNSRTDHSHIASHTLALREKQLSSSRTMPHTMSKIGSTELPYYTPTSGMIDKKTAASTRSEQNMGTQGSGQTTAVTFEPLNSSSDLSLESLSTANTDRDISFSLGETSVSIVTDLDTAIGTTVHPRIKQSDMAALQPSIATVGFESTTLTRMTDFLSQRQTPESLDSFTLASPYSTFGESSKEDTRTDGTQRNGKNVFTTIVLRSQGYTKDNERTTSFSAKPMSTVPLGILDGTGTTEANTMLSTGKAATELSTDSSSFTSIQHSANTVYSLKGIAVDSQTPPITESYEHTSAVSQKVTLNTTLKTSQIPDNVHLSSSTNVLTTHGQAKHTHKNQPTPTTTHFGDLHEDVEEGIQSSTARGSDQRPSWTVAPASRMSTFTKPYFTSAAIWSSTVHHKPTFYIVPDEPAVIRVESIELLLQIIVEDAKSTASLEEETAHWLEPFLQRAPGFRGLLGVWSGGLAVQCLLEFNTKGALMWLNGTEAPALLEQTGLAQAVQDGRSFRLSKIRNITLGGFQGEVCDWLLQCPSGFRCVFHPGNWNHSCTSVCHSDYCHHHGICTHHPGQLPVCRCLVGEDFWYMGQRCDVRMTRARLVVTCLSVLLIAVAVIGVLAFVAVRRYRTLLIQAKVDQTQSSYRRFNHFDELSGRFWLPSRAGSADSLDNPAFTRSEELLHLRALDRPCCYHDDTMSLPSTCPSRGTCVNTIYPHSSQYAWRGSDMTVGDGVLDSGKASDLSVCSWPVEPIQWTPFPLLQQLAMHRSPTQVRVSRPRSYCEGMELVDMSKSWTA